MHMKTTLWANYVIPVSDHFDVDINWVG